MTPLIYIASIGRSGSTLLESMLGAHSQIATAGELHIWPQELRRNGVQPCGCGQEVTACPFWNEVRNQADPLRQAGPGLDFFREAHNHGRTLRPRRLAAFGAAPTDSLQDQAQIKVYGENNAAILEAFSNVTEAESGIRPQWIVDASKDPYRLAWLARSGLFQLKVIHLVKNPRGFAYSVTKSHIHGENGRSPSPAAVRLYYTARQMAAWTIQNRLFGKLAKHVLPRENYLLLQYETMASEPNETFRLVCEYIGVPYEAEAVESFRRGSLHTIAGNPMRYERRGIVLDERWKAQLPPSSRRVAGIIGGWTERDYGYSGADMTTTQTMKSAL